MSYAPLSTLTPQGKQPSGLGTYGPMDTTIATGVSPQLSADLPSLIIDPTTGDWWVPPQPQPSPASTLGPILLAGAALWFFMRGRK